MVSSNVDVTDLLSTFAFGFSILSAILHPQTVQGKTSDHIQKTERRQNLRTP